MRGQEGQHVRYGQTGVRQAVEQGDHSPEFPGRGDVLGLPQPHDETDSISGTEQQGRRSGGSHPGTGGGVCSCGAACGNNAKARHRGGRSAAGCSGLVQAPSQRLRDHPRREGAGGEKTGEGHTEDTGRAGRMRREGGEGQGDAAEHPGRHGHDHAQEPGRERRCGQQRRPGVDGPAHGKCFACAREHYQGGTGQGQMHYVGQYLRRRTPLGQRAGDEWPDPEPCRQCQRGPPRTCP